MEDISLADCYFCGSDQVACTEVDVAGWAVGCKTCLANGSTKPSSVEAINSWQALGATINPIVEDLGYLQRILKKLGR